MRVVTNFEDSDKWNLERYRKIEAWLTQVRSREDGRQKGSLRSLGNFENRGSTNKFWEVTEGLC